MTDEEVRHAIKGIVAAAATGAQVYEWNVLSHELAEWPGLFGTARHGWIIKRVEIETKWKNIGGQRCIPTWTYDIWGFYGFRSGAEGDNSDDEFSVIVDAVGTALKAKPTLDLAEVEKHDLLQVLRNTTINCGQEVMHLAQCRLKVLICC